AEIARLAVVPEERLIAPVVVVAGDLAGGVDAPAGGHGACDPEVRERASRVDEGVALARGGGGFAGDLAGGVDPVRLAARAAERPEVDDRVGRRGGRR